MQKWCDEHSSTSRISSTWHAVIVHTIASNKIILFFIVMSNLILQLRNRQDYYLHPMKGMSTKCPLLVSPLHVHLEIHKIFLSLYNNFVSPRLQDDEEYIQRKCGADFRLSYRRLWKDLIGNKRHNTPHSDRYGISGHAECARPQVSIRK